jgi:hypothetical protein
MLHHRDVRIEGNHL